MADFKIAILGCGTVGGGVARIVLEQQKALAERAGRAIELAGIVDLFPAQSAARHGLPRELYRGSADALTRQEAQAETDALLEDASIELIVETIGGSGEAIKGLAERVLESGKHLVTANKALLAAHGPALVSCATRADRGIGYEAAVCGAIPIVKGLSECFTGDEVISISGIMNGTSNYILSKMDQEGQTFGDALSDAQARGYAEADPTLDIDGGDAGHKLTILLRLAFGLELAYEELPRQGIVQLNSIDMGFAREMDGTLKLICFGQRAGDDVYAAVGPMIVKRGNLLSKIDGATNAVRLVNRYSAENVLIGQGAGSLETGSAIVSDIVFLSRYRERALRAPYRNGRRLRPFEDLSFPYSIVFETTDVPGITGIVATAIGTQDINIQTVSHNRHGSKANAVFAIATMPCTRAQIDRAVADIQAHHPGSLLSQPRVFPILE